MGISWQGSSSQSSGPSHKVNAMPSPVSWQVGTHSTGLMSGGQPPFMFTTTQQTSLPRQSLGPLQAMGISCSSQPVSGVSQWGTPPCCIGAQHSSPLRQVSSPQGTSLTGGAPPVDPPPVLEPPVPLPPIPLELVVPPSPLLVLLLAPAPPVPSLKMRTSSPQATRSTAAPKAVQPKSDRSTLSSQSKR